jgi:hypothetical protein
MNEQHLGVRRQPIDQDRGEAQGGDRAARPRHRQAGQLIPMFGLAIFVLIGMMAIVIDVSWYWSNTLKVQRAADAAALAGAVWLPGNTTSAYSTARQEATKNGYTAGGGVTVTPIQDSLTPGGTNPNQLDVTVSAPVKTFFMRIFGMTQITATRTSKAEYIQPVPMGSPLNYYGVYQDCKVSGSSIACTPIPEATGAGTLASQGFFGAIEGQGADRQTGDAYATGYNPDPTANAQYDVHGYDYVVNVAADGSDVYIYDPTFCATTSGPGGGHLGAGDHWLSTANHSTAATVSTYYMLIDTKGTGFTTADDTTVATSGSLFEDEFQVDKSAAYATASGTGGADNNFSDGTEPSLGSVTNCAAGQITNPALGGYWHNKWWRIATNVPAGTYRLNVTTTSPLTPEQERAGVARNTARNANEAFENMWSLEVVGGGNPTISGAGRMVSYANIESGSQIFYLAQIDARTGAGKTMVIDLFDPGDVGDKAWLQILSPDGNVYTPVRFDYVADGNASAGHTSGSGITCLQTYGNNSAIAPPTGGNPPCTANATSGGQFYQNSWVEITIALPASYGSTGLTPCPGGVCEPAAGWWKIKYTVNKGNDTTTWQVGIRGNPVHLVVP